MRKYIGLTSKARYFMNLTNINISVLKSSVIKIYNIPFGIKIEPESINIDDFVMVYSIDTKNMDRESFETRYDTSNYLNNPKGDRNGYFRLFVNDVCVHSAQYLQKYLIEFEGEFTLTEEQFVDH